MSAGSVVSKPLTKVPFLFSRNLEICTPPPPPSTTSTTTPSLTKLA